MIFNEIYGTYYKTMTQILKKAQKGNLTSDELYNCILDNAYSESIVPITDSINKEKWQLLTFSKETNQYSSIIKHIPQMPLTKLQLQYLKTILFDKRIRLFDLDFDYLEKLLEDVEPLWLPGDYEVFDKYADGDDFEDAEYKKRFQMILEAKIKGLILDFTIRNRYGKKSSASGIPITIEYSEKDDKFRVILLGQNKIHTINLGRIISLQFAGTTQNILLANPQKSQTDTLVLELTDERNSLERVSMHFANLKKKISKVENNKYQMEIEFCREDETEMVIRLLQFGPVIKVLKPDYIVSEIVKRLSIQLNQKK